MFLLETFYYLRIKEKIFTGINSRNHEKDFIYMHSVHWNNMCHIVQFAQNGDKQFGIIGKPG